MGAVLTPQSADLLIATVHRLRELGAVRVVLGPCEVEFQGPIERRVDPSEVAEMQRERERQAAAERARLENWSA